MTGRGYFSQGITTHRYYNSVVSNQNIAVYRIICSPADDNFPSPSSSLRRDGTMDNGPLHQAIAAGLSELGMPAATCRTTTFLIRDGHCVGQRFLFDQLDAVWLLAENVVRFYDETARMLKSVSVGAAKREEAA